MGSAAGLPVFRATRSSESLRQVWSAPEEEARPHTRAGGQAGSLFGPPLHALSVSALHPKKNSVIIGSCNCWKRFHPLRICSRLASKVRSPAWRHTLRANDRAYAISPTP